MGYRGAFVAAVTLAAVLWTSSAFAHARYERSEPPNRGTVSSPPSSIWADFSEPPAPSSYLHVYDPCGRRVDNDDSQATGYRLTVTTSAAAAGTYRVDWAVLSTLDGHTTRGTFTFTSLEGEPCRGQAEPPAEQKTREREARDDGPDRAAGPPPPPAGRGGKEHRGQGGGETEVDQRARRRGPNASSRDAAPIAADVGEEERAPASAPKQGPPGFPLDGLVIGLALAALVGASGGFVYAGIMGGLRR